MRDGQGLPLFSSLRELTIVTSSMTQRNANTTDAFATRENRHPDACKNKLALHCIHSRLSNVSLLKTRPLPVNDKSVSPFMPSPAWFN
jgi:hypothetical protein